MKRISPGLVILMCAATVPAISQQLQQPTVPANRPVPTQSGIGPQLKQAQAVDVPKLATDPSQRPQSSSSIPSSGPAKQITTGQTAPALQKSAASVLDSAGKPLDGLIQIAPNRVYDPATGVYHWTRTDGKQQKLID